MPAAISTDCSLCVCVNIMDPGGVAAAVYCVGVNIGGGGSGKEILSSDVKKLVREM